MLGWTTKVWGQNFSVQTVIAIIFLSTCIHDKYLKIMALKILSDVGFVVIDLEVEMIEKVAGWRWPWEWVQHFTGQNSNLQGVPPIKT